jgi:hydrogenase/urease accessory protein HupE
MMWFWLLGLWLGVLGVAPVAQAHEVRPAYLEINETTPGRYDLLWRTPRLTGQRLPVVLELPVGVRNVVDPSERVLPDSVVERRVIDAGPGGLAGRRIAFRGLELTITDVLVRVADRDGGYSTTLVRPSEPWIEIQAARGWTGVAGAYLAHGVAHILLGFDHLLFVFALLLIVGSGWPLVTTITAFTLAHSVTLALATLGVVRVPGPPVEAVIALSIVLLATEMVRRPRGGPSLTRRAPWAVAFAFGLLHGLGFAGALTAIGLPQGDVALALFTFNVGVEVGQLLFVCGVLALHRLLRQMPLPSAAPWYGREAVTYAIGTLAAFWFFERLSRFWT